MSATVSIIIPTYNIGAYLGECLDSVFASTYEDFHIFLCDDGSSDDTLSIARRYQEQYGKMTVVENERNRGACYTRNRLLDMADGKYIAFHDGDDLMPSGRLGEQVKFLDTHADIDAVGGQSNRFTDDSESAPMGAIRPLTDADIKVYMTFCPAICIITTTVRRESLRGTAVHFDESYKAADDYEFLTRLVPYMRFKNFATPHVFYRLRAVSLTHSQPDLLIANHTKIAKRYLRTYFNIDAQDDVIGILSWPQKHPPRSVTADQSKRALRLIVDLQNIDLMRSGEVTYETKRFITRRLLPYFNRIPLDGSVQYLRSSATANVSLRAVVTGAIKWYILCALEITRLWRLRGVRQLAWKHQYSQGRNK